MKSLLFLAVAFLAGPSLSAQSDSITPNYLLPKLKMKSDGQSTISPVSIVDFNVRRLSRNRVLVTWHTELEQNSKGFGVERRLESEGVFKDVGFIHPKSNGDSTQVLDYRFTDANDFDGTSYYRIRQKDNEGTTFYSSIKTLKGW